MSGAYSTKHPRKGKKAPHIDPERVKKVLFGLILHPLLVALSCLP